MPSSISPQIFFWTEHEQSYKVPLSSQTMSSLSLYDLSMIGWQL